MSNLTTDRSPQMAEPDYQLVRDRLIQTRKRNRITLRQAGQKVGVSAATLSRFERGAGIPDLPTLNSLIDWLDLERSAVFAPVTPGSEPKSATPERVEVLLRGDRNLDRGTAQALSNLFKTAYHEFTKADPEA